MDVSATLGSGHTRISGFDFSAHDFFAIFLKFGFETHPFDPVAPWRPSTVGPALFVNVGTDSQKTKVQGVSRILIPSCFVTISQRSFFCIIGKNSLGEFISTAMLNGQEEEGWKYQF